MTFRKKTIDVPCCNHTEPVPAVVLWYVRWYRRHGVFMHDVSVCVVAFPVKADATRFAEALRAAYALIRHTSGTEVSVTHKI